MLVFSLLRMAAKPLVFVRNTRTGTGALPRTRQTGGTRSGGTARREGPVLWRGSTQDRSVTAKQPLERVAHSPSKQVRSPRMALKFVVIQTFLT